MSHGSAGARWRILFAACAGSLLMAGCQMGSGLSPAIMEAGVRTGLGGEQIKAGYHIYNGRCIACHSPEPVGRYSREEWSGIIPDMAKRSKLTPAETAQLRAYVTAALAAGS
jgi:mono/diheme cytochrome c family protein